LHELGLHTTKTVWSLDCPEGSRDFFLGDTLQDASYLEFVHDLVDKGFELAWHCATMESSDRDRTVRGLEFFYREFGFYPRVHCNHALNRENVYWGAKRYSNGLLRVLARIVRREWTPQFSGEVEGSPYFWGDLCLSRFQFVRNFTFNELNVLNCDPDMPYRLKSTPYVNYWFSAADAEDVEEFNQLCSKRRIDRLAREGGVGIVATHLGKGFARNGHPDPQLVKTLRYLATLRGWFVPVSDILDHLLKFRSACELSSLRRLRLELRHAIDRAWAQIKPWN